MPSVTEQIERAIAVGLSLRVENSVLVIEGPNTLSAEAIALELLQQEDQVIRALAPSRVVLDPLPIDMIEKCFNGNCPAILGFKQGLAYCSRCGVHQRIVS